MKYYFDTSAYVKLYHEEDGSEIVENIVNENANDLCFSRLIFTEIHSALFMKVRTKEKSEQEILEILYGFERDMQFELIVEMEESIFKEASDIIKRFGAKKAIKTYDAIHLACCSLLNKIEETTMVSCDKIICEIAQMMGIEYINPKDSLMYGQLI